MQLSTAVKVLENQAEFLGMSFLDTLEDIKKEGGMVYSDRVMSAFRVFVAEGQKLFATEPDCYEQERTSRYR